MLCFCFQLPEDFEVMFDEAAGEITIGGIYLRLFIQQPAWVGSLKRNKKPPFLSALFSLWSRKSDTKVFSESNTIGQSQVENGCQARESM